MSSNFGTVVSAVARIRRAEAEEYAMAGAYGAPSECNALIGGVAGRQVEQVLAAHGYTPDEYDAELEARTTPKWAYFSGLQARR